jgi:glucose dehydrogenase
LRIHPDSFIAIRFLLLVKLGFLILTASSYLIHPERLSILRLLSQIFAIAFVSVLPLMAQSKADWPMFGHDPGSMRFSPLTQITAANVNTLTRAWTYHLKIANSKTPESSGTNHSRFERISEATPIVINGVMYLPTPYGTVIALDSENGKEIWTHKIDHGQASTRGVAYWHGDAHTPASIIFGTNDGRLISLDAITGEATKGFGKDGIVDMRQGIGNDVFPNARLVLGSPAILYKNLIITGSQVQESPKGLSGDVRAWDVHTGKMVWQFHSVPRIGEIGHDTWPTDGWQNHSGNNVWGLTSVDVKRGIVFLPFASPSYDFYGGDRKGGDLFGDSIVALNAATGKLIWYFQTVHHDITDYDLESAPVLVDVKHDDKKIPAVVVVGKRGLMYILDRRNGKPIYGVEERPIPQSDVPGEQSSPTQPFPLKPVPLGRESFSYADMANVTPEHRKACEALYQTEGSMQNQGPFTPIGTHMTVMFPGTLGVLNWQGFSYDPTLGYAFVNTMDLGDVGKVQKAQDGSKREYERTSPWGTFARFWQESTFWPCQRPPWGQLWAININTGDVAWKVPFGTIPELDAKGIHDTGSPNYGGSIVTASNLVFIAATNDRRFRAFDGKTGKILWETQLETGSYNVPMTYQGKNGKQYIALVATGGSYYDTKSGDSLIAFALPKINHHH